MTYAPIQTKAELEYGEPFEKIIQGFAEMGYTKTETAEILGYSKVYSLTMWMRRNGVHANFLRGTLSDRNRTTQSRLMTQRQAEGRMKRQISLYEVDGITGTLAEHAQRLRVNINTVYARKQRHRDGPPEFWLQPSVGRGNVLASRDKPKKDHPWR